MSGPGVTNCPGSGPGREDRAEFGVLFVAGFGDQRSGTAIAAFAGAVYHWLYRWNARPHQRCATPPSLSNAVLNSAPSADDQPAHVKLAVPLHLSTGSHDANWLLAESSWADLFSPPQFLGVARWIWKVSTCLLVLQFVIPMHRHWNRARRPGKSWHRRWADRAIAPCYFFLMVAAATMSVLLSLLLLALAVVEKLPIPRIDQAVRWVAVKVSAILGDSYMLAHCPVQFAAMRTKVAEDLRWLQDRCAKVAIVAHSQGAAIAHQVLRDNGDHPGNVQAFITFGQGISKLAILQRMDWDPRVSRAAWWSRALVTLGMLLAGLPVVSLLARHWTSTRLVNDLVSVPAWLSLLLSAGVATIVAGVYVAMHAVHSDIKEDLALPEAGFWWTDYYASADPVSNGPFVAGSGQTRTDDRAAPERPGLLPGGCRQVYNSASVLLDHNRYLRNQDQLLSRLINDLAAAAYGDSPADPAIVHDDDLKRAGQRRHRLILLLITARILAPGMAAAGIWLTNLGPCLSKPMNQLIHSLAPHMRMSELSARLLATVLVTAAIYLIAVIGWQIRERYVIRDFFCTARRSWDQHQEPSHESSKEDTGIQVSATA
jgi:hypothetical protein